MKIVKVYQDDICKEFDIIINNKKVAYYYEFSKSPITNEILDNPVFEMYYDYDGNDYNSSIIADSLDECLDELINWKWDYMKNQYVLSLNGKSIVLTDDEIDAIYDSLRDYQDCGQVEQELSDSIQNKIYELSATADGV